MTDQDREPQPSSSSSNTSTHTATSSSSTTTTRHHKNTKSMYNNKKDIDLPPGWTTEKKTRMDGKTKGQTDTYYISPSGGRYRSRKECERVLSNLEPPKKRHKKRTKHMPPPPQRPPNIVVQDISNGRETLPIRCVNEVDNETPPRFKYIPKPVPRSQKVALALSNCPHIQCACMAGDCTNSYTCACAFDKTSHAHSTKGTLIYYDLHVIRECSELCPCHRQRCPNRVVNNGIHVRLEVFKTIKCGWGVRTLQNIPAHTFIAEYSGEILSHDEAESRKDVAGGDSYFLDTETLDELRQGSSSNIEYVLDAKLFGNVSRFFNGSCSPNMIKEKVTDRDSIHYPLRLAFYASRDISIGEELCWNYEYFKTTERGSLNKSLTCHCGADNCCGVMY